MNIAPVTLPDLPVTGGSSASPRLDIGDIIQVKVLDHLDSGLFLVRFRGQNVIAESSLDLQRGTSATGIVVSLDPRPLVRLYIPGERNDLLDLLKILNLPLTRSNLDSLGALLRRSIPVDRGMVIGLASLTADIRSVAGLSVSPDRLLRFLIIFQSDLGGLASFLKTLPTGDSYRNLLDRMATHFSAVVSDVRLSPYDGEIFLYLPIWWNPEAGGEVRIFRRTGRRSSDADDESHSEVVIVIFLDPSPFGPMKIEIIAMGKMADLAIEVTDPDIRAFLAKRFPLLEMAITQLGYQDVKLACRVAPDLITHRLQRRAVDAIA